VVQQQTVADPAAAVPAPTVAPPDSGAAPGLSKLRSALAQLGPSEATEYTQRLREAVRDAGASGWRRLDDQELEQLAWHALGGVGGDVRSANLAANQAALQRFLPPPPGSDPALDATRPAASSPAADPPADLADARAKTAPDLTGDAASKPPVTAAVKDATLVSFLAAMKTAATAEERAAPPPPADPPPPRDAPAPPMSAKDDVASGFAAAFDDYVATKGAAPDAASGGPQAVLLRDLPPVPVNAPPPPDDPPPSGSAATAKKHNDAELSRASEQVDDARLAAKVLV
jgi:hypothetical protein